MQLENSHGGFAGRSLVNVMQETLDSTYIEFKSADQSAEEDHEIEVRDRLQGMVAGMAKMIGIIRGTSVRTEINECKQRVSERSRSNAELAEGVGE